MSNKENSIKLCTIKFLHNYTKTFQLSEKIFHFYAKINNKIQNLSHHSLLLLICDINFSHRVFALLSTSYNINGRVKSVFEVITTRSFITTYDNHDSEDNNQPRRDPIAETSSSSCSDNYSPLLNSRFAQK